MEWLPTPVLAALIAGAVAFAVAALNPITQRRIEKVKAELADHASSLNARRAYEFDARKRLYTQLEPLFFQLFEAAEGSYYRVASLVRTQRDGYLDNNDRNWLSTDGYYLRSTIYRLILPLAIFRLIQRSATFVDLALDDNIRTRYTILRLSYFILTDDFVMAGRYTPRLDYDPHHRDWQTLRDADPARHRRQGFVIGHLDRLIDSLIIVDGEKSRPMTYGEFEDAGGWGGTLVPGVDVAVDILLAFSFSDRPVLARLLHAHACVMKLLLATYPTGIATNELPVILDTFLSSAQAETDLQWWTEEKDDPSAAVRAYLHAKLRDHLPPKHTHD